MSKNRKKLRKKSLFQYDTHQISDIKSDLINNVNSILPKNGSIKVRINKAVEALNQGMDPQKICRLLDWREFEYLALEAFRLNEYAATKGFIFKSKNKRFQIDIVAFKNEIILSVDCKHWIFANWFAKLKEASESQSKRTEVLSRNLELLTKKFDQKLPKKSFLIPIILTLGDPRANIIGRIPIVSVLKLRDFLYGLTYPKDLGFKYYDATLPIL